MSDLSDGSAPASEFHDQHRFEAHHIALTIVWIVTTVICVVLLLQNVRLNDQFSALRYVLQTTYVLALLWYLGLTKHSAQRLHRSSCG